MDLNELLVIVLVVGLAIMAVGERLRLRQLLSIGGAMFLAGFFGLFLPPVLAAL